MSTLKGKQARFVEEYLKDLNATQAAIRADYSEKTAESQASRLLRNVKVLTAIQEAQLQRAERVQVDADYVLNRLVEIDRMDVLDILNDDGSLKAVREWPIIWRQYIGGMDVLTSINRLGEDETIENILKKIKWPDKVKNLELIGKHITVQAWREQHGLSNAKGGPIEVTTVELVAATGDEE
tara:strand:+ start:844 stop:1389 length:546 start_codon:yes stop_codon:yes gene_type:complete